jgi:DNA polymerase-4
MSFGVNREEAQIIFCDLNSAFAMAEQQAHPSLRGRPMGVTNRISKNCCIVAASYEAKALGIKGGSRLSDALAVCPDFIVLETDPPKYHHMYQTLARIMKTYSPNVYMKSIDEGVIDLHGTMDTVNKGKTPEQIGHEIKQRLKREVGSWMKVNIGIAPNRFLAKQAASWHKPDGLDRIDHHNLLNYYKQINLTDLSGIASHYEARLNAAGIFTPMDFLEATGDTLKHRVFHSVIGEDWHQRLRGYEVDDTQTKLGSIGRQWVLGKPTADDTYLLPCFQYLCETTGKKLRYREVDARGILVWLRFQTGDGWYQRKMFKTTFYTDQDIYTRALYLLNQRPKHLIVQTMGITCYQLTPSARNQISLLEEVNKADWLTTAVDEINEQYGTFKIFSANSLMGKKLVKQKIPFGGTKYFELLLQQA